MDYVFYFDESFHDRKITIGEDAKFNILADNALDNYIGVFWGCPQKSVHDIIARLNAFEREQKQIFGLKADEELKSTTIKKKNFVYGIRSFNRNAVHFYKSLFSLLCDIDLIIQVDALSKMEFFIRQAFKGIVFPPKYRVDENSFYYSMTKFLITYRHDALVKAFYDAQNGLSIEDLRNQILTTLDAVLAAVQGIPRKEREIVAFGQLRQILAEAELNIKVNAKLDFRYFPSFDGLCNLLQEINIKPKKVKLIIDEDEKTFITAQQYPFGKSKQANSKNVIQLHLSDFISGFIGRIMYAISNDANMTEDEVIDIANINDNDLERKRILSHQWFAIDEEKFLLYRLVHKALFERHQHYWTIMTMSYSDNVATFCTLIKYFAGFEDFSSYQRTEPKMHSEYFNAQCCAVIADRYAE